MKGVDVGDGSSGGGGQGVGGDLAGSRVQLHGGGDTGGQLTQVWWGCVVQLSPTQTLHGRGWECGPRRIR